MFRLAQYFSSSLALQMLQSNMLCMALGALCIVSNSSSLSFQILTCIIGADTILGASLFVAKYEKEIKK